MWRWCPRDMWSSHYTLLLCRGGILFQLFYFLFCSFLSFVSSSLSKKTYLADQCSKSWYRTDPLRPGHDRNSCSVLQSIPLSQSVSTLLHGRIDRVDISVGLKITVSNLDTLSRDFGWHQSLGILRDLISPRAASRDIIGLCSPQSRSECAVGMFDLKSEISTEKADFKKKWGRRTTSPPRGKLLVFRKRNVSCSVSDTRIKIKNNLMDQNLTINCHFVFNLSSVAEIKYLQNWCEEHWSIT